MYYTSIVLKGKCYDTDAIFPSLPFISSDKFNLVNLILITESIIRKKSIKYIFIEYDQSFTCTMGQLEQIYNLIKRLTVHGKKTCFFAKQYDEKALYLCSACSTRIIPDPGVLSFLGFQRQFRYFKNLLDKIEVEVDVIRRGKFKGAFDMFRLDQIDEAQKIAYGRILEVYDETAIKTICSSFGFTKEFFKEKIEGKFISPSIAKEIGIITDISNLQQYINTVTKNEKLHKFKFKRLNYRFGKGDKVAVLSFDGGIKDGENDSNSPLGEEIGDRYFIKQIEKIRKNKRIKSVILKVNSPGGSATASDAVASELLELRKEKDLVVVQSGIAGSGGYYISFPGEKIFTQNTTITGSIGVITVNFNLKNLYDKTGLTHSTLKTDDIADINTTTRKKTAEELKILDSEIERIYDGFISNVAKFRNKTVQQVDEIAQGRVWTGFDAVQIGIADEIGDLHSALDYLKEKHKVKSFAVEFYPKKRISLLQKLASPKGGIKIYENDLSNKITNGEITRYIFLPEYLKRNSLKALTFMPELFISDYYI